MALTELLAPTRISQQAVADSIREAATRGERYVSIGRVILFSIIVVRQAWILGAEGRGWAGGLQAVVTGWVVIALIFSVAVSWRYRNRPAPDAVLAASVALDVGCCFVALLGNSMWPSNHYRGNLMIPDIAFIILPIVVSCVRLYPFLVVEATVLSGFGFAYLVYYDFDLFPLSGEELLERATTLIVMIVGSAITAIVTSIAIQRTALDAAERSLHAKGIEGRLGLLMRDHHDARTLLSAAALNAELVYQRIADEDVAGEGELQKIADDLRQDLRTVNDYVASIRERAYSSVRPHIDHTTLDVSASILEVVEQLQPLFPGTTIVASLEEQPLYAVIAGEPSNLLHAIQNLVTNACEGDGEVGASRVDVRACKSEGRRGILVEIRDDGPGLPDVVLTSGVGQRTTTKVEGSGLGLWLVESWLFELDSSLQLENDPAGGAIVRFELPAAP